MSVPVAQLEAKHPDYALNCGAWSDYELLYKGGRLLKESASRFLIRRPKEPEDVYSARLKRFIYTNLVGTIAGWYAAKLFRREPEIDLAPMGSDAKLPADRQTFFDDFLANVDRRQTSFIDFFRDVFSDLLIYGRSYYLLDLPYLDPNQTITKQDQMDAGGLNPYLCLYKPVQVTNWATDTDGNLKWVLLTTKSEEQEFLGPKVLIDRWTYFDRQEFTVFERRYRSGEKLPDSAEIVQGPAPHALAKLNRVPLYCKAIRDDLWLADRSHLSLVDHLNTENTLAWALMMNNLAIPVISGAREDQMTLSEVGAYFLGEDAKVQYLEQSGNAFKISADRLSSIREEIYRTCYLMAQGRSSAATPAAQSGYAKEMDAQPANDVLNCYGDIIRAAQQEVLVDAGKVRGYDNVSIDIRGYAFEGDNPIEELELIESGLALNVPSESLDKELMKRAARLLLADANQNVIAKVAREIDAAPSKAERQAIEAAQQAEMMASKLRQSITPRPKA